MKKEYRSSLSEIPTKIAVKAILNIMYDKMLDYDCTLYEITKELQKKYTMSTLKSYGIPTTIPIMKCLEYIRENKLLEKRGCE